MKRKSIFASVIGVLVLLACTPVYVIQAQENSTGIDPKNVSLLELCDNIQEDWIDNAGEVKRIYVCAHRANTSSGIRKGMPDNSIPNIRQAIAAGADMVELDVRTTSDGELVLMHNESIDATTNGRGKVSDLTLAQIKSYQMKRGDAIYRDEQNQTTAVPTLLEALLETKDKIYVNLDLSGKGNSPSKVFAVIKEAGVEDQVMLYAGNEIEEYQKLNPLIAVHPYIGSVSALSSYSSMLGAKLFQYSNSIYIDRTVEHFGTEVHKQGYLSYSNLLDSYDTSLKNGDYSPLDAFIDSGSDFVQTDVAELVISYLEAKGLR